MNVAYFEVIYSDYFTSKSFLFKIFINDQQSSRRNESTNDMYTETEEFLNFSGGRNLEEFPEV